MPTFLKKYLDLTAAGFLLLCTASLWLSTISTPYWWDSAGYIMIRANNIYQNGLLNWDLGKGELGLAHPVFFIVGLSAAWKIFGQNLLVSHSYYLVFALIAVFYTYQLGRLLSSDPKRGRMIGFLSSVLLLITPLFMSQLGIIYFEMPLTAFALASVYYFLQKKYLKYVFFGSLMLLSKEVSVFVIGVLFLYTLANQVLSSKKKYAKRIDFRKLLITLSPLLALVCWFGFHFFQTGWFYIEPGKTRGLSLEYLPDQFGMALGFVYFSQWRFLTTLGIASFGTFLFSRKAILHETEFKVFLLFLIISAATVFTFGLSEFLPRYALVGLPFYYLAFLYSIDRLFLSINYRQYVQISSLIVLLLTILFYTAWNEDKQINNWYFPPLEDNLEYLDVINVSSQVADFLEKEAPGKVVYSTWPLNYMLTMPFQGFVQKPVNLLNCKDFKDGDKIDFLVFHFFSPEQPACAQIAQKLKFEKAYKFEKNGKFMIIYSNPSTPSAQEKK